MFHNIKGTVLLCPSGSLPYIRGTGFGVFHFKHRHAQNQGFLAKTYAIIISLKADTTYLGGNTMDAHNNIGLLEIFDYLNQQLKENAMQLELTIYGGRIMTMVFDNRPAIKDINCVFSLANDKLLKHILKIPSLFLISPTAGSITKLKNR